MENLEGIVKRVLEIFFVFYLSFEYMGYFNRYCYLFLVLNNRGKSINVVNLL